MNPSWLSYLLCLIVWTGAVFELLLIAVKAVTGTLASEPLVGTLLTRSSGADRVAPITILLLLAWVLIESLLHALRARREAGAVRQFVAAVDGSGSAQGFREVTGRTRAARRARLTGELQLSPEALHDMLPGTSSLDGQEIDGFYGHLRVYVWTLPVVGFIGTAWGMSHAIAGFSDALSQSSDVKVLTARLGQVVIPGLASAFSTTILALTAAVIGHFCTSVLQGLEQRQLDELDQASVRLLARLPRVRRAKTLEENPDASGLTNFTRALVELTANMEKLRDIRDVSAVWQETLNVTRDIRQIVTEMHVVDERPYQVTITRGAAA